MLTMIAAQTWPVVKAASTVAHSPVYAANDHVETTIVVQVSEPHPRRGGVRQLHVPDSITLRGVTLHIPTTVNYDQFQLTVIV